MVDIGLVLDSLHAQWIGRLLHPDPATWKSAWECLARPNLPARTTHYSFHEIVRFWISSPQPQPAMGIPLLDRAILAVRNLRPILDCPSAMWEVSITPTRLHPLAPGPLAGAAAACVFHVEFPSEWHSSHVATLRWLTTSNLDLSTTDPPSLLTSPRSSHSFPVG